ncbi:hypothetical protein HWV62_15052 [Athelia sp. TMB]|nr:hypothetical protein HWV62_15052 [Athelia sp. TMB]
MAPSSCAHVTLLTTSSSHAVHAGYTQLTAQKRLAATTTSGRAPKNTQLVPSPWTFPAPLALPGDELAYDPSYPPQSLRSWKQEKDRNQVTANRRTIYVAAPPTIKDADAVIRDWTRSPLLDAGAEGKLAQPKTEDVIEYLSAFYHPIPVRPLPTPFRLTTWDEAPPKKSRSAPSSVKHVALAHGTSATRILVRTRPVKEIYTQQLGLDVVLDCAIAALPDDAYALLLLVHHDLYEGGDDAFCCGRAYGGSREVELRRYQQLRAICERWVAGDMFRALGGSVGLLWSLKEGNQVWTGISFEGIVFDSLRRRHYPSVAKNKGHKKA